MTSGSEKWKNSGRSCKANRNFRVVKISYPQFKNDAWKTRFVTDSWLTVNGGYRPSVRLTHTRQPPGGTLSSSLPPGFILS